MLWRTNFWVKLSKAIVKDLENLKINIKYSIRMVGWFMLGFAVGVMFSKGIDKLQEKAEKKIEKVEADIVREETIKAIDKVKEELEKEK